MATIRAEAKREVIAVLRKMERECSNKLRDDSVKSTEHRSRLGGAAGVLRNIINELEEVDGG